MKKRIALWCGLSLALTLTTAASALSQDRNAAARDQIGEKLGDLVETRYDQPYAENDNKRQMVDLYLPKNAQAGKPLPMVVFIHGGGWQAGDRRRFGGRAAKLAATGKYATASVGYRLSNEAIWPAQIHDCKAALRWIRGHAKELNIDPERIGVTGSSAGGHLVTMLGLTAGNEELEGDLGDHDDQSSSVACVVNFCGPTDLAKPLMQGEAAKRDDPAVSGLIGGGVQSHQEAAKAASPLTYVSKTAAPIMTVHGTNDQRVNFTNAVELDAALKNAGTVSVLVPVQGAGHGIPVGPELTARILAFWEKYLYGVDADISTEPITP